MPKPRRENARGRRQFSSKKSAFRSKDDSEYTFDETKTRTSTIYHSVSLPFELRSVEKERQDKRATCGWSSSIDKAYRPLGTPDLDRSRPIKVDGRYVFQAQKPPRKESHSNQFHRTSNSLVSVVPRPPATSGSGYSDLRDKVARAHARKIRCKHGKLFTDRDEDLSPPKRTRLVIPKLKLPSPTDQDDPAKRGTQSARDAVISLPDIDPAVETARDEEEETQIRMNAGLAIDVSELSAANAIQASFVDLHKTRELLNTQLSSELVKQDSERIFSFQRKFCMFERVPPQVDFSINSWLTQAEKYDEEKDQKLSCKYPWYAEMLQKAAGKGMDVDYEMDGEVQDQFFQSVKQLMRYSIKSTAADFFNIVLKLPVRRGVSQANIASTLSDMCKHFNVSETRWRTVMTDYQRPDLAVGLHFGSGTARKIVTPRALGLSVMTFR